jgi:hypothetical protein
VALSPFVSVETPTLAVCAAALAIRMRRCRYLEDLHV